jgi:hypothetical protein
MEAMPLDQEDIYQGNESIAPREPGKDLFCLRAKNDQADKIQIKGKIDDGGKIGE